MSTEGVFDWVAIQVLLRTSPTLRCAQDYHWPLWHGVVTSFTSVLLDSQDVFNSSIHRLSHFFVNFHGVLVAIKAFAVVSGNEVWLPAHTFEVLSKFFIAHPSQDRWVGDLETVDLQDRQNGTILDWVDELVREPGSSQRTSFGFTVTDFNSCDLVWVVQNCTYTVGQGVTQFPTFVQ